MIRVKQDRACQLRDARSRPAGRILHQDSRHDACRQGKGRRLSRHTVDHHSVVLRKGAQAQCVRVGFQIGRCRSRRLRKASRKPRHQDRAPQGSGAVDLRRADLRRSQGHRHGGVQARRLRASEIPAKGIVPHKLGHVAFHVTDVKHTTKFYCDVLGFRESDWMARLLFVPALRSRPPHHQSDADRLEPALSHCVRAARLGPHADGVRFPVASTATNCCGGPGRHGIGHNLFAYHRRPNGLITETCSPSSTA